LAALRNTDCAHTGRDASFSALKKYMSSVLGSCQPL